MGEFPKNFLWGSATSAHQVEGGNVNDWSEWEKNNADRLAREAKSKWRDWQQKKFPEMFETQNYISGRACDHYNLYEKDFDIAKSLGHNAHRFSLEWSRIEPEEGKFNEEAIEHYKKVILALRERGLEPFVTIWHWTNPLWIRDIGGWENKKTVDYFARYVREILPKIDELKSVRFWIPLNEPNIYIGMGYLKGASPPGKKSFFKAIRVFYNLVSAQKRVYKIVKEFNSRSNVGTADAAIYFEMNGFFKFFIDYFFNRWFLEKIGSCKDFIGCNYYTRRPLFSKNKDKSVISDLGWDIYPEGICGVLKSFKKFNLPIYITENGIADAKDEKRTRFIKDHLRWLQKAAEDGIDVRGYLYWSLLDNFEMPEIRGFWPRFGLVEIDYRTMQRRIRSSAWEYKRIIDNGLPAEASTKAGAKNQAKRLGVQKNHRK